MHLYDVHILTYFRQFHSAGRFQVEAMIVKEDNKGKCEDRRGGDSMEQLQKFRLLKAPYRESRPEERCAIVK